MTIDQAFLDLDAHGEFPALAGGFTGRLQTVITGGPDGDVKVLSTFESGRRTGATLANDKDAEVTITIKDADLRGVLDGSVDLNVLFMTGAMKTGGATGPLLDLIEASRSPEGRAALERLAGALTGA